MLFILCFSKEYAPIFPVRSQLVNSAVQTKCSWNPAHASKPKLTNEAGAIPVLHIQLCRDLSEIVMSDTYFETDLNALMKFSYWKVNYIWKLSHAPFSITILSINNQHIHQPMYLIHFITDIKILHVSAPGCHPQGVTEQGNMCISPSH